VNAETHFSPIADTIIFENDSVPVWKLSLAAGDIKAMHRHELPYLIIPLSGGTLEIKTLEGAVSTLRDQPGMVLWGDAGEAHQLRNLSPMQYENILVEVKRSSEPLTFA
jgi:beta-alanine degradation protein BauB